jgi:hypothetical protein
MEGLGGEDREAEAWRAGLGSALAPEPEEKQAKGGGGGESKSQLERGLRFFFS